MGKKGSEPLVQSYYYVFDNNGCLIEKDYSKVIYTSGNKRGDKEL